MDNNTQSEPDKMAEPGSRELADNVKLEAYVAMRHLGAQVTSLAMGLENLDIARQSLMAFRSPENQQALANATRHLHSLLEMAVSE